MSRKQWLALALTLAAVGCGDDDGGGGGDDGGVGGSFPNTTCDDFAGQTCVEIDSSQELLETAALLDAPTVMLLSDGVFALDGAITIRADGVSLVGQGIDTTTLSFSDATTQFNGVDVVGDDFLVQDLTVLDSPKDGIRVEDSDGVTFRRIRSTWTNEDDPTNGAYGIYPVKSQNVLVEDSFAENASDAGLYVGQCQHVIVRRNTVRGNVAGLEIENTQFADVYENLAENNTGGIVVFDLPGNPIVGRDVRLRNNTIRDNNNRNFASSGTVGQIPSGTGTFAMASRRVEITDNAYENNDSVDIAIVSGLVIEGDASAWSLDPATLSGQFDDLDLDEGATAGTISNYRTQNVVVARNTHSGSGTGADLSKDLGLLLRAIYGSDAVDSVIYDAIGESSFDAEVLENNSNDNHVCVGGNTGGSFASLDLETQADTLGSPFLRVPEAPFGPFDCTDLDGGPVAEVTLP